MSLLALKECIRAMDMDSKHIPFRTNKLTLALRDCFVGSKKGNNKLIMIACLSPGNESVDYSLNTLYYANLLKGNKKKVTQAIQGASYNSVYKSISPNRDKTVGSKNKEKLKKEINKKIPKKKINKITSDFTGPGGFAGEVSPVTSKGKGRNYLKKKAKKKEDKDQRFKGASNSLFEVSSCPAALN